MMPFILMDGPGPGEARYAALREQAREAAVSWAEESAGELEPRALVARLGELGLLRYCVPAAWGGAAETVELRALCAIREGLAYHSGLADTLFIMQGLGSYPVTLGGSEAQQTMLLPRVARGECVTAFALTEPEAGSDVSGIATRAEPRPGGGYRLTGTKCFISNAGLADSYVVLARTGPDRHRGLTAFLVPAQAGLRTEPVELIAAHPIGTVHFDGIELGDADRIGAEGEGFRIVMATLDRFRASVGAAAVGMAARALDAALARVVGRRQFGRVLAEFQATQMALAEMAVDLDAARLLVERAAVMGDRPGARVTREVAMAKLYATEAAQRIIDRALQLHGGLGVVRGQVVERLYREVRALRIYEGTSEIQKLVIARELLRGSEG
jgi:acyl-CoA dehydrogenase